MANVYGVTIRKGGQGKSTTVSMLARLCALAGARVLVVDLAQPGTSTGSLRDLWPAGEHSEFSSTLLSFQAVPAGQTPDPAAVRTVLEAARLPVTLASQPSWSGGCVRVLPWDELLSDAAAFLHSERVLAGFLAALQHETDLVFVDFPADSGPLLTNAIMATETLLVPLVPETPALEGLEATLRLLARVREAGHPIGLAGILLTHCDPKNKRCADIVQTIRIAGVVEGESLAEKLYPFAIKQSEFYEQAFRYGEPIWERIPNPSHWVGYVLLAERILRDAGLPAVRRGPTLQVGPDTHVLDTSALMLGDAEMLMADFEKAHAAFRV
ncbi:MAG TPA: ParA family protein [Ktedonobacterales bacterium]|nr:ParA family protein [Ktedonobacterales bacterium]